MVGLMGCPVGVSNATSDLAYVVVTVGFAISALGILFQSLANCKMNGDAECMHRLLQVHNLLSWPSHSDSW